MFLSKNYIKKAVENGEIGISDFNEANLKSASYTLTLNLLDHDTYTLEPGCFVLLETKEKITFNNTYCGIMATPSALARQGINVTQGSDFAEPDTNNVMVLEISNNGSEPVIFENGMKILKIAFTKLQDN